ncbi:ABC transporter permease [Clostridium septicum]|uniref:ABC transporter permease n=1 Tax=Clostridium septicum TaxID=1504 RepID=A0A9N7PJ41_CLOSE|nr:ABC transporter permease subunit [Clostridium septicum]AYE34335.1 ABC transporter permease [Clostridium septicum]MDU1315391.1 ABC transporter permease subunit [Clostridium septicum]QAS59732.1 ABC transporter permease subunit [Clostridium septicum]UEC21026.1 ABC transporter permease subunit [Clostridium septicum]USS00925.1 ABC transporter permease subunit [Clostridium septicum]
MRKSLLKDNKYMFISIIILLILWQMGAVAVNNQLLFPSLDRITDELHRIILNKDFINLIFASLLRCLISFIISIILAIILGTLSYINKFIYNFLYPIFSVIKSIPTMAFIVLALIWISKDYAPIMIGGLISIPIYYEVVLNSLLGIDENIIEMCEVYRVKNKDIIISIYLPTIIFGLINVFSSSLSLIFKVVISGEIYSQPKYGIGAIIQMEKMQLNTVAVIAWIIIISIITILFDKVIKKLSSRCIKWNKGI